MIEEAFLASSDEGQIGEVLAHLEADGDAASDVLAVSDAEPR
jgi:hypothetical protein